MHYLTISVQFEHKFRLVKVTKAKNQSQNIFCNLREIQSPWNDTKHHWNYQLQWNLMPCIFTFLPKTNRFYIYSKLWQTEVSKMHFIFKCRISVYFFTFCSFDTVRNSVCSANNYFCKRLMTKMIDIVVCNELVSKIRYVWPLAMWICAQAKIEYIVYCSEFVFTLSTLYLHYFEIHSILRFSEFKSFVQLVSPCCRWIIFKFPNIFCCVHSPK